MADYTGTLLTRVTYDRTQKFAAALAPDAHSVAYVREDEPKKIYLTTIQGNHVSEALVNTSFIAQLGWARHHVLWYEAGDGHLVSTFTFWQLPSHDLSHHIMLGEDIGLSCVLSSANVIACSDAFTIEVKKKVVAQMTPFAGVPASEILHLTIGQSTVTRGTPAFRVEVQSVARDVTTGMQLIALRVEPENGPWAESFVRQNDIWVIPFQDAVYGFSPTIHDGAVDIQVFKQDQLDHFAGPLAWAPSGEQLAAIVSHNESSSIVIYSRHSSGQGTLWHHTQTFPLPEGTGPIVAIAYRGDGRHVVLKTQTDEIFYTLSSSTQMVNQPAMPDMQLPLTIRSCFKTHASLFSNKRIILI
jgi:hypothetical protein